MPHSDFDPDNSPPGFVLNDFIGTDGCLYSLRWSWNHQELCPLFTVLVVDQLT